MHKKYKFLSLALSVTLVASLTACGANDKSASSSTSTVNKDAESTDTTASSTATSNVSLSMVFWDSGQEPGLNDMAAAYMKENPNVTVTVQTIPWDEYWTKMQAAATSGDISDMADILVMHPDEVEGYVQGGYLMDLTDILKGSNDNISNYPEFVVNDFLVDGKYYGIPKDIGTIALVYNKDLFDKYGVSYPTDDWTWDDLKAAAQKLTDKDNGVYGFMSDNDGQETYWDMIWQNGGDLFDSNGKCTFDSPETVEAMKYAVSFVEEGLSPKASDLTDLTRDQYFESGKVAMMNAGSWMLTEYLNTEGLNFDVAELPHEKQKAAICSGMAFSVANTTKNPEEAKKFVEWLGGEEAQTIEC
jgi:multiple sugar transport system substrate-binding protein